jgi:hypothetical protein
LAFSRRSFIASRSFPTSEELLSNSERAAMIPFMRFSISTPVGTKVVRGGREVVLASPITQ